MKDEEKSCLIVALAAIALPVIVVFSSVVNGFVLTILWKWFVIPVFSLPALNIPQAIGISMVIAFLTHQRVKNKDDNKEVFELWLSLFFYSVFYPLLVLGISWIVQLFL
jgi:hypothetical protein